MIQLLETEFVNLEQELQHLIESEPKQKEKQLVLPEVDGIRNMISCSLLALSEVGRVNRKQIASLVGLAPHAYESGKCIGYRRTNGVDVM